jgi:hypothetical protein
MLTLINHSWRNIKNYRRPIVKWGAIQSFIEESPNDTLILLDCCASGIANTSEGSGVTEIITACAWNQIANGVGEYSLTNALTIELERLSSRRSFSVGELYRNVFLRTQSRLPTARAEDGRDWERHPAPIHLVLTQDSLRPRSIQLSVLSLPPPIGIRVRLSQADFDGSEPKSSHQPLTPEAVSTIFPGSTHDETPSPDYRIPRDKFPRLAFAIRLRETFSPCAYNQNLFTAWLKDMPAIAEEVKVEAGFDSFSTLLIVSIPFALSAYMPSDAAVVSLGPISSENKIILSPAKPDPDLSTRSVNNTFGLFRRPMDSAVNSTPAMLEPWGILNSIPELGRTSKEEEPSHGIHGMYTERRSIEKASTGKTPDGKPSPSLKRSESPSLIP